MLRRALVAVSAAVLAGLVAAPSPVAAQTVRALPVEALGTLSPELVGVPLAGSAWAEAYDVWDEARIELADAERDTTSAAAFQAEAEAQAARLDAERRSRVAEHERAAEVLDDARDDVVDLAVADFIDGAVPAVVLPDEAQNAARQEFFGGVAADRTVDDFDVAVDEEREARKAATAADEAARAAAISLEEARTAAVTADQRRADWAGALDRSLIELVAAAPLAEVDGTDLTAVTVDAYVKAAGGVAGCVDWALLAGIGRIETRHGTYRGSSVDVRGDATPRIVGIALDGANDTMAIGDTDGGALDGDATTDRAVGPMQFIPSTWVRSGVDGNADGIADPNNLYDAAAAAARYLCRAGGVANVDAAVFSYNHSTEYVADVTTAAAHYRLLPT